MPATIRLLNSLIALLSASTIGHTAPVVTPRTPNSTVTFDIHGHFESQVYAGLLYAYEHFEQDLRIGRLLALGSNVDRADVPEELQVYSLEMMDRALSKVVNVHWGEANQWTGTSSRSFGDANEAVWDLDDLKISLEAAWQRLLNAGQQPPWASVQVSSGGPPRSDGGREVWYFFGRLLEARDRRYWGVNARTGDTRPFVISNGYFVPVPYLRGQDFNSTVAEIVS